MLKIVLKLTIISTICSNMVYGLDTLANDLLVESEKGRKIFRKFLRKSCKSTATNFAQKHLKNEWMIIMKNNQFTNEIKKICTNDSLILKDQWITPLYTLVLVYSKQMEH